jgi:hypothetical protein
VATSHIEGKTSPKPILFSILACTQIWLNLYVDHLHFDYITNWPKLPTTYVPPLTHTSTLAELMQTTNTVALAKFVACCHYQRTICPPWSTFRLMDSLVPNGCEFVLQFLGLENIYPLSSNPAPLSVLHNRGWRAGVLTRREQWDLAGDMRN